MQPFRIVFLLFPVSSEHLPCPALLSIVNSAIVLAEVSDESQSQRFSMSQVRMPTVEQGKQRQIELGDRERPEVHIGEVAERWLLDCSIARLLEVLLGYYISTGSFACQITTMHPTPELFQSYA